MKNHDLPIEAPRGDSREVEPTKGPPKLVGADVTSKDEMLPLVAILLHGGGLARASANKEEEAHV